MRKKSAGEHWKTALHMALQLASILTPTAVHGSHCRCRHLKSSAWPAGIVENGIGLEEQSGIILEGYDSKNT